MSRSFFARVACVGALALSAAFATGCGPDYDRIDITPVAGDRVLNASISKQGLEVGEGLTITAYVVPWNDDDEKMPLAIFSNDTNTVEIVPVVNDRNYMFIGKREGTTEIRFVADGTTVLTIPARVTKQPAP